MSPEEVQREQEALDNITRWASEYAEYPILLTLPYSPTDKTFSQPNRRDLPSPAPQPGHVDISDKWTLRERLARFLPSRHPPLLDSRRQIEAIDPHLSRVATYI